MAASPARIIAIIISVTVLLHLLAAPALGMAAHLIGRGAPVQTEENAKLRDDLAIAAWALLGLAVGVSTVFGAATGAFKMNMEESY